ncbi:uncharacterized protein LOC123703037 [Colias croceus]|uniref:uncharacterized protein LOC123703037 n=1 Tax=Colias crocea TaxID=72248 RepID=UPI001E27F163|nr:uncharacterized protein LOC123703037 [Colias croceus]
MSGVEQLLALLEDTALLLQKAQTNLKKCPKQRLTKGYVEARLQSIEEYWNTFKEAHNSLADLKDLLINANKSPAYGTSLEVANNANEQLKLPKILLPTFSGSYEDWPSYRDMFQSLVHNNSALGDKLDPESHKDWEEYVQNDTDKLPSWEQLQQFLQLKFRTLELLSPSTSKERSFHIATPAVQFKPCPKCQLEHALCHCKEFISLTPQQKNEFVRSNNICFNCLCSGHVVSKCRLRVSCKVCQRRHHSLLHQSMAVVKPSNIESHFNQVEDEIDEEQQEQHLEEQVNTISSFVATKQGSALLATALVPVTDGAGRITVLRTLIDQGSQANFISERAAQLLKVKRKPLAIDVSITGIGSTQTKVKHTVGLELLSRYDDKFQLFIDAYVISTTRLTNVLPSKHLIDSENSWSHLQGLVLADPTYNIPGRIDMLLGVTTYAQIIKEPLIKGPPGSPCAQETSLGWILFGSVLDNTEMKSNNEMLVMHHRIDVDEMLQRLWELDPETNKKLSIEEETCERTYKDTYTRTAEGRYVVKLPVKHEPPRAIQGDTRDISIFRFKQLESKFVKSPDLKREYINVINEYLKLNHMEEVPESEINNPSIYLPHHAVIREASDTTKVRVVFNASATGKNNISLNDDLLVGPLLQEDMRSLIMRWRLRKIAFVADIEKMYRQILIKTEDADYQRIVWRNSIDEPIKDYRLLTVTFGTASAPYLAVKTLHQIANDEGEGYPAAVNVIKNDFFMDDLLSGQDSVEDATKIAKQISNILSRGGMKLQKWSSNNKDFLKNFSSDELSSRLSIDFKFEGTVKTLGLSWNVVDDTLHYYADLPASPANITKRTILSEIQRLFDPLVHGFCDASSKAYGAVAYLRVKVENNTYVTGIIAAKSRVAPVKPVSLPRLELCGAVLLAKLLNQISDATHIPTDRIYGWTDSTVVLSWLQGDLSRWQTFVRNRVATILETIGNKWYHVPSVENPADVASRGMLLPELKNCKLWWEGPKWLRDEQLSLKNSVYNTNLEKRKNIIANTKIVDEAHWSNKFKNFNNLYELLRAIVYCTRFLNVRKIKEVKAITTNELHDSLNKCVRLDQRESFSVEIEDLKQRKEIKHNSCIKNLNPYLDAENILRVGGRLRHAHLVEIEKHPMILSNKSCLTTLIIADAHKKTLHGGTQLTINYIRSRFWIIKIKSLVSSYINKCFICARLKAKPRLQIMGDLPEMRVTPSRPFLHSGVDFAGPLQILTSRGRGSKTNKAYICIFVCMSTKAVHLELVGDLSTDSFLGALKRFVARRGRCSHIWSDQGTNFVGANKELLELFQQANLQIPGHLPATLAEDGIQWHFNPPYSPNFGGLWEAGVKSIKYHLRRILDKHLTFEEMTTLLCQIEACLNSRPLCPIDNTDTDNLNILTPGHFLIGEAPFNIPEPDLRDINLNRLSRWQYAQRLLQDFWKRWQTEYLSRLQQRPKWLKRQDEFKVGDVVLVVEEHLPPDIDSRIGGGRLFQHLVALYTKLPLKAVVWYLGITIMYVDAHAVDV